ncbi:phage terminase small subunit [Clostridium tetani]|uniref:terminase small subunit n=1 Tax=Clostridium tetani TaxID=1513 RepID=UPI002954CC6D|nr:terminase small subunit [Clostridium tetani]BDR73642.1 phage terminase small subunit [Clostridium tetani]
MADIRGPDWNLIKEEYLKLNGKVKLKEFAEKHGVKYSTLRSRKNREKWDNEINKNVATKSATQQKNVATENKTKNNNRKPIAEEVKEVLKSIELTDKQRLFCIYYIKYFNATKAYQKAYKCSYEVANVEGHRTLVKPSIKNEIEKLKQHKLNRAMLETEDIFQKFIDIAFADISDYVAFGKKEIEVDKDEEGNPVMIEVNYVDFKNSNEVDGTLISEVSQGKNGVSVKLQDKMKAMKWLADHMDLATEEQKARIEVLKSKIANNEKSKEDKIDEYFTKLEEGIKNAK